MYALYKPIKRRLNIGSWLAITVLFLLSVTGTVINLRAKDVSATVPGINTLLSVNTSGVGGNGDSPTSLYFSYSASKITKNGRYFAFNSSASDLVSGDTNAKRDVFVRNLKTNTTTRASLDYVNAQLNDDSDLMDISENGRYVLFMSSATNATAASGITGRQLYLRDIKTGSVTLISYSSVAGGLFGGLIEGASVSHDGRFVLVSTQGYIESTTGSASYLHVYMYDLTSQLWTILDAPKDSASSDYAQMSCDGAYAVFQSNSSALTTGDTNGLVDIFLVDRRAGDKITNITQAANGNNAKPVISCNGSYIGFITASTNLVSGLTGTPNLYDYHYLEYDRLNETFTLLDYKANGTVYNSGGVTTLGSKFDIDDSGNAVFRAGANLLGSPYANVYRIYARNVSAGTTEALTLDSSGAPNSSNIALNTWPTISADGKLAIFGANDANNVVSGDTNGYLDIFSAQTGF